MTQMTQEEKLDRWLKEMGFDKDPDYCEVEGSDCDDGDGKNTTE